VTFRCPEAAERFRKLRGYGFERDYDCQDVGLNGKISEMNAALAYLSLDGLDEMLRRRRAVASLYRRHLQELPGIRFHQAGAGDLHSFNHFAVLFQTAEHRAIAEQGLRQAGVETKRYFLPVHTTKAYAEYANTELPVTTDAYQRALCLPIFHDIRPGQVRLVCRVITRSLRDKGVHYGLA
jgi:dTDP-4-amino-4,6-dideoxygalactose transaminase